MKMTATDYQLLKDAMQKKIVECNFNVAQASLDNSFQGFTEKRFRWDLLHLCNIRIGNSVGMPGPFPFYDYLDDNHIDTALKSIVKDLLAAT